MSAKNGLPCSRCGASDWMKDGRCRPCRQEYQRRRVIDKEKKREGDRKWRTENADKKRATDKQYYEKTKDQKRAYSRQWSANNRERKRESRRQWYEANKDKVYEQTKQWQANNPEKRKESVRRWDRNNREYVRAKTHKHRAKKAGNGGSFTEQEWRDLCNHYGNKCLCCGRDDIPLTVDHVLPVDLGGNSDIDNIQPLCKPCNSSKGNKHIDYRTKPDVPRWSQGKLFA